MDMLATALEATQTDLRLLSEGVSGIAQRMNGIEGATNALRRRIQEIEISTRPAVKFVGDVLPDMRSHVADASRLANESAQAIEEILQQELLIRRDLDALLSPE